MQRGYITLLNIIIATGITQKFHIIDNECSKSTKTLIRQNCSLKIVPPHCHQRNVTDVFIKAFKQHFLSIIAGVEANLSIHQWEFHLPQAKLTLNLLQKFNTTPTVSSYTAMFGPLDYNRMPLGLMRCAVLIHEKTNAIIIWENHAVYACYLHTSPYHYCSHIFRVKETNA